MLSYLHGNSWPSSYSTCCGWFFSSLFSLITWTKSHMHICSPTDCHTEVTLFSYKIVYSTSLWMGLEIILLIQLLRQLEQCQSWICKWGYKGYLYSCFEKGSIWNISNYLEHNFSVKMFSTVVLLTVFLQWTID